MPEEIKGSAGSATSKIEGGAGDQTSKVFFPATGENGYSEEKKEDSKPNETSKNAPIDFKALLVRPHEKKSRPVEEKDLYIVIEDAHKLYNLCHTKIGPIPGSFAIHHSQIEDEDPMNFFVTADKEIVINPVITRHTKTTVEKVEGCVTFYDRYPVKVQRYNKIEVEFSNLTSEGKIGPAKKVGFSGREAQIFQHEIGHALAQYIYEY